jgi:starvation-inducible outer membrane lipoprotein
MKTLLLVLTFSMLTGCATYWQQMQAEQQARQEAFQRDWDAMTPDQRMQYRLAQQQLAAQQAQQQQAAWEAQQQRQQQLLQSSFHTAPLNGGSTNCTSTVMGNTVQTSYN